MDLNFIANVKLNTAGGLLPITQKEISVNYRRHDALFQNDPAKIITCVTFWISWVSSTSMIRHALSRIVARCRGDFVDAVVWNTWNQSLTCFRLVKMFLKRCYGVCIIFSSTHITSHSKNWSIYNSCWENSKFFLRVACVLRTFQQCLSRNDGVLNNNKTPRSVLCLQ